LYLVLARRLAADAPLFLLLRVFARYAAAFALFAAHRCRRGSATRHMRATSHASNEACWYRRKSAGNDGVATASEE
jgi:hypothetical protein